MDYQSKTSKNDKRMKQLRYSGIQKHTTKYATIEKSMENLLMPCHICSKYF